MTHFLQNWTSFGSPNNVLGEFSSVLGVFVGVVISISIVCTAGRDDYDSSEPNLFMDGGLLITHKKTKGKEIP
jgi:hypothetical protein